MQKQQEGEECRSGRREKNAEAAGLVKVHGYRIDEAVKEFEVRF